MGGHLRRPRVRRSAGQGARLRAAAGRACRSPCFVHRRRARAAIRRSCAATSWRPVRDDGSRIELDPDYDKHGGFPIFEAADPGPGFGRFLTAMRRAQDLAVSANPDSDTWDRGRRPRRGTGRAARPVRGGRGCRSGQPGAEPARRGQPADAAVSRDQVRSRRRRIERAVQPVLTSAATTRCTAACCRCCSTRCSAWSSTRRADRSAAPPSCTSTTARSRPIDTTLTARGWMRESEGRKAFVNAELRDPDGQPAAPRRNGLMIRLLPGQP